MITPVFNGERFIRQTVESVLSQHGDFDLEYIVKDGGSTDRTLETLAEYKDRLVLISEPDRSPQHAINTAMSIATGEIGCWLNSDDLLEPGSLQAVCQAFKSHPGSDWLYGRCRIVDENNVEMRRPITLYKNLLGYFFSRNVLLCENFINQPATFWRMHLWRKCGELTQEYTAAWDYELWLKMAYRSRPLHLRQYLARFRRHTESISEKYFLKQFAEELDIIKQHGNRIHRAIHTMNYYKIVAVYELLNRRARRFH